MKREEHLICEALIHACRASNTADCAEADEVEMDSDQRGRIVARLREKVSVNQIESAFDFMAAALKTGEDAD